MSKKHKQKKMTIRPEQFTGLGFSTYLSTKGMTYSPTTRDQNRKQRKQAKLDLKNTESQ
jgi:hypothetical protein